MTSAYFIHVRGIVQGVGFRPFVYRLARENELRGWVLNAEEGVEIHVEGEENSVRLFLDEMKQRHPEAAVIADVQVETAEVEKFATFAIRESSRTSKPTVRISPDLPVCENCLKELFDKHDRRYLYPYINCTNCGPRYSVIRSLPYDRPNTTMASWLKDEYCSDEYSDPANRRFHAQPVACADCGPHYYFQNGEEVCRSDEAAIRKAANDLISGRIIAVKGLGGYHLACDAKNAQTVLKLRERKFRKEKPFALMAKNLSVARGLVELNPDAELLLNSAARPIVLARCKLELPGVAPDNSDIGVMLPYTPLHHLLFAAGAPEMLVMTSANRSSEPIAFQDESALQLLSGIADGFLIGERPIARRMDDSVARAGIFGPAILRRGRGYAPGAAATIPTHRPILAMGADLKNSITLVVDGQCFVSQHIGDLDHYEASCAFRETVRDFLSMYEIDCCDLLVVHDAHPQYVSTQYAQEIEAAEKRAVQHHRAHVTSVLAEHAAWDKRVIAVSFDGTGYGDDGAIWGGEIFSGSVVDGFERIGHLRPAILPGGDAAASYPVQAAAGFLAEVSHKINLNAKPFSFPPRYNIALQMAKNGLRCFPTTSVGRLFDTAAALLGFTREMSFEGQAAIWLEHRASHASNTDSYPFPFVGNEWDYRPLLDAIMQDRLRGRDINEIARAFHLGIAAGLCDAVVNLCDAHATDTTVLSGGVFQNELLLRDIHSLLPPLGLHIWANHVVPANDGGISLGQAAAAGIENCSLRSAEAVGVQNAK